MERVVLWHRLVPSAQDEVERPEVTEAWLRRAHHGLSRAGGKLLATLGSSLAMTFEVVDLEAAVDAALTLLDEAEREDPPIRACLGIGVGELSEAGAKGRGVLRGNAIDRAQLLANRGRTGDLVLDATAQARAESVYLFARHVATGQGTPRGRVVDRAHRRRAECRPAIDRLRPPTMPAAIAEQLGELLALAAADKGSHRVLLRGPVGSGATEWIAHLVEEHGPPLVLRLEAVPAALEPLGSLRLALVGVVEARPKSLDLRSVAPLHKQALAAIAAGQPVDFGEAVEAVRAFLDAASSGHGRPWLIADTLTGVDSASLEVLTEATATDGPSHLFLGRLPPDVRPPPALDRGAPVMELTLPLLKAGDARLVAQGILGAETPDEVTRRVAVLGGYTPLGVAEAARALIAAGDLVEGDNGFTWRLGARGGVSALPVESLIGERLASLEPSPRKVLEGICASPPGSPSRLLRAVIGADGIEGAALDASLEQLRHEALVARTLPWRPTSSVLRAVINQTMPPSRIGELYRFVADGLEATQPPDAHFAEATRGYYLAEGGHENDGARSLLVAGIAAAKHGFGGAAVRLAAAAVQFDPSAETRAAATKLSRSVGTQAKPPPSKSFRVPAPTMAPPNLVTQAVRGILRQDFESVDRAIDTAIAEGRDRHAANRMRAMGHLARGDLAGAISLVARAVHGGAAQEQTEARNSLARAIVLLHAGEVDDALRDALQALAWARDHAEPRGEAASLRVLAMCFRSLDRPADADALELAAPA
jgi:hypothetical protein